MSEDIYAQIEVTPREVSEQLARGEKFLFVDVREKWEHDVSHIEGATLIPLREIPANVGRFEKRTKWCSSVTTGCAAWTRRRGCGRREWQGRVRWRAESSVGRWKLIHACRAIEEIKCRRK